MKPVDQEFLHDKAAGVEGDCFRAVLASILERPIAEVPHFADITKGKGAHKFWSSVYEWLEIQGYEYMPTKVAPDGALEYHSITGPSPRGNGAYHAVVGLNQVVAHDPHPSRSGISGDPGDWYFGYIVPTRAPT
jgi:hypothetical protein